MLTLEWISPVFSRTSNADFVYIYNQTLIAVCADLISPESYKQKLKQNL